MFPLSVFAQTRRAGEERAALSESVVVERLKQVDLFTMSH